MAKGYLVGELVVTNPAGYEEYRRQVPAIIAAHQGRYVIRAGDATRVEGEGTAGRVVVVEFPSLDAAKSFYHSPEYQAILPHRTNNSTGNVTLVAGFE